MFPIINSGIQLLQKSAWRPVVSDLPFFWKIPAQYFHMTAHAELLSLSLISIFYISFQFRHSISHRLLLFATSASGLPDLAHRFRNTG